MLLHDFLLRAGQLFSDKVGFVCGDQRLTYAELLRESRQFAIALRASGVQRGDRICVLLRNSPLFVTAYFGASFAGATVVPINPRLTGREVAFILEDSDAKVVLFHSEFQELVRDSNLFANKTLVSVGNQVESPAIPYADYLVNDPEEFVQSDGDERDIALQIYTSGTTGRPKGAMLSHRALVFNALTMNLGQRVTPDEVFLTVTPLAHAAAGVRVYNMVCMGATHVSLPMFDADEALATIEREHVTSTVVVPAVLSAMLRSSRLPEADLSSLRLIIYGAAPMPQDLIAEAMARIPTGYMHAYGLTEGCPYLTRLVPEEHAPDSGKLLSIGQPAEGVQVRILDEFGSEVPDGEVGEMAIKSEKNMSGYWKLPQVSDKALREGWLMTGDLVRADSKGYLYLAGRTSDMLISGGLNVYPREIEQVIEQVEGVGEVAVVGVSDSKWGEVPVAFVVPHETGSVEIERLKAVCRRDLADYKRPKEFRLVSELPRNSLGKVLKTKLSELLAP